MENARKEAEWELGAMSTAPGQTTSGGRQANRHASFLVCNKKLAGLELRAVYSIDWKLHPQSPSLFGVDSPSPSLFLFLSAAHTFPRVRFSAAHMAAAATAACCMHAWKTSQNDVMTLIYLPTPSSAASLTLLLLFCPSFSPLSPLPHPH